MFVLSHQFRVPRPEDFVWNLLCYRLSVSQCCLFVLVVSLVSCMFRQDHEDVCVIFLVFSFDVFLCRVRVV